MANAVGWIITSFGLLLVLLGWFMTPDPWGWGLIGLGAGHIILGTIYAIKTSEKEPDR